MNRKRVILSNSVIIIALFACGNFPGLTKTTEPQSSQTQAIPSAEELSQPTILPTTSVQPTEQPSPYSQIQATLRSHPPCEDDEEVRKEAILTLNEFLKSDSAPWDPEIIALYDNMIGYVESEIKEPVSSGMRIWLMYNHGFIVKTPSATFAFDLIHGYSSWNYRLPDAILDQIDVLFISHKHGDHREPTMIRDIEGFGGKVVAPLEDKLIGYDLIYASPDEELAVAGLQVKAYEGWHGGPPVRMYKVTTPEGITIMHTGDNLSSETLPDGITVDILLLNAWVNESGSASALEGIPNSINKLTPSLTILGHIHELGHQYDPNDIKGRFPFDLPLALDDTLLPGEVSVQIWGEHCDFPIE